MLTVRQKMALDIAGRRYRYEAVREQHVRERLGCTPTRFWQIVDALLDDPEALAYAPTTVRRLARLREQRRAARTRGFRSAKSV
jgi:hypothetical protein